MIGGNMQMQLQIRTTAKDEIGDQIESWATIQSIRGWLDMLSGDSTRTNYSAKIQESTHVFVADFVQLDSRIRATKCRALINNAPYDVTFIDNPMELNKQLEIFLKYTGV